MIFTKEFWKAALIRALYTVASTALSVITVSEVSTVTEVNWTVVLSTSLLSGIISILKSIVVGMPEVNIPELETKEEDIK